MNSEHKSTYKKIALIFIVALVGAILVEILGFNFKALTNRLDKWIPIEECKVTYEEDGTAHISYKPEQPLFVNKLMIEANAEYNMSFVIHYKYNNPFDLEEEEWIVDHFIWKNRNHYTMLDEEITYLSFNNPNGLAYIWGIRLVNEIQMNWYRVMLVFSILFVLGNIVFLMPFYQKRLEVLFLIIGLLFGITMIGMQGVSVWGWDEAIHFDLTRDMIFTDVVEKGAAVEATMRSGFFYANTVEEKEQLLDYYDANGVYMDELREWKENNAVAYNKWGYIPQALLYKLGTILNLDYSYCYMLGKLGNLLLYLLVLAYAIKIAKDGKMIIMGISLMPTPLFIATTYSYDSFVNALFVLGFVLLYNGMLDRFKGVRKWYMPFFVIALFGIGSLPKAVYVPGVLLALFLVNKEKFKKNKLYYGAIVFGVIAVFLVVMSTFVLPAIVNTVANNVSYGGDSRGGDTSATLQMISILKHPFAYTKLLLSTIFSLESFGVTASDEGLITSLCFFNMNRFGIMPDKYAFLHIPYLIALTLFGKKQNVDKKYRRGVLFIFFCITCLIWTALYLAFTLVGKDVMMGIQARYYLPMVAPLMLVLPTIKVTAEGKEIREEGCNKILLSCSLFFLGYCIYFLIFKNICL